MKKPDIDKIRTGIIHILEGLKIDWENDQNFKETPDRVLQVYLEFNKGRFEKPELIKTFLTTYNGIVFMNPVEAVGLCPHHLLPIHYKIIFAYIPNGSAIGLSKISRIIKHICAQPLLQEEFTNELVKYFNRTLHPIGTAVVITGIHGCMKYRGIKENEIVRTSKLTGAFYNKAKTRNEFYALINGV